MRRVGEENENIDEKRNKGRRRTWRRRGEKKGTRRNREGEVKEE